MAGREREQEAMGSWKPRDIGSSSEEHVVSWVDASDGTSGVRTYPLAPWLANLAAP